MASMNGASGGQAGVLRAAVGRRIALKFTGRHSFLGPAASRSPERGSPCVTPAALPVPPRGVRRSSGRRSPTFASFALLASGVAVADTVTTDFEAGFPHWDGQRPGWLEERSLGPFRRVTQPNRGAYDQAVVPSGAVLPRSGTSRCACRTCRGVVRSIFQTYSPPVTPPAGENLPNTVYIAKFSFSDPAYQDGTRRDRQSGLWRRLAHGLGGSAGYSRTVSTSPPPIAPGPTAISSIL